MSIWQIIRRLVPYIRPHGRRVALSLTLLSACAAQVNPIVLRYTVDTIERPLREGRTASQGASLLLHISAALLGKEIANAGLTCSRRGASSTTRTKSSMKDSSSPRKREAFSVKFGGVSEGRRR
jgi:hypothetical protein